jgi:phage-related protein
MNEEMRIVIRAITSGAQKEIKKVSAEIDKLGAGAKGSSGKMSAVFKGVAKGAAIAVGAIVAVGTAMVALGKKTLDAQKEFAKLNAAFEASGSTAKQAGETYNGLFRFLGESDRAVEAAGHLAKLTNNQQALAEWTKITQGIYATFGDSLPIEGLTEAANETARVGKVVGTMADALNWAGVSEDEMNAKLAQTNSLSEREAILRSTLNGLYNEAAEVYERNNKALLDHNESQARYNMAVSAAGSATLPLLTALNNLGTAFFTALKPALDAIIPPIATFVNWIAKAIQSVMSFFSALTGKSSTIKAVGEIGKAVGGAANGANNLASGMKDAGKAAEEAKKSTQGFDELNIVSSGSGSGSGGGSGGSGGGAGYAGGGGSIAEFGTEVEEAEGTTNKLAESIKKAFGEIGKILAPSIQAWGGAFETIKQSWNNAKPDFINGAIEIKDGFIKLGNYLGKDFIPTVINSFSTNLAPVVGDTFGFIIEEAGKAFSWLGSGFKTAVGDVMIPVFERIKTVATDVFTIIGENWKTHGGGLLESLSGFFEKIRGHFDNFYTNVFKPIWDKILEAFDFIWVRGLKPLVDKVVDAVMVIASEITIFYNKVLAPIIDWIIAKILPPIVNIVNGIIDTVKRVAVAVAEFIGGIVDVVKGVIQFIVGVFTGDWSKAWEGIKNILAGVWDAIGGIFNTFKAVLEGIGNFVKDVFAAAFKIAWEAIKLVWSQVVAFFKNIWDNIVKIFTPVANWFKGVFSNAWTAIKNVFSNWGSFFAGLWDKIKSTFSSLGTKIADAIGSAVKKGINGVITTIENTINSAIRLINGAIGLINMIPGVSIGRVSNVRLPRLAKGGIVDSATIAMIGEQGKEAVVPLENNTGWMDKLAERIAARSATPTKVVLQVGEKELGWATISAINGITQQTGGLKLVL